MALTSTAALDAFSRITRANSAQSGTGTNTPQSNATQTPLNTGTNVLVGMDPSVAINSLARGTTPDLRVRLRPLNPNEVYGDMEDPGVAGVARAIAANSRSNNLLSILRTTGGMVFPYTPTVSFSQDVSYQNMSLTHTNMDLLSYNSTPNVSFNVMGKFSVQNQREGKYLLACLHFLRTASKMYFGEQDAATGKAGLPPPMLVFSGYGSYMFNDLRVVLKSHSYTFDDNVDMVTIEANGAQTRLPALMSISMNLEVQQTPKKAREEFSLDSFRRGDLMRNGNSGWI